VNRRNFLFALFLLFLTISTTPAFPQNSHWSEQKANSWYAQQPWLVGSNYVPRSAINQLEMWQEASFDPALIDQEFTWAESLGMNTMRVFLHDLLWQQDATGFRKRIDRFLTIASRHHIRPMLVLFDSCWDPLPHLGPQHPPIPGVHNSGWVQSPGVTALADSKQYSRLKDYVQGVVGAFANDDRILAWNIWNEPGAENAGSYPSQEMKPKEKVALVAVLLPQAFAWPAQSIPLSLLPAEFGASKHPRTEPISPSFSRSSYASRTLSHFIITAGPRLFAARLLGLRSTTGL
jgi:hypothetical protein